MNCDGIIPPTALPMIAINALMDTDQAAEAVELLVRVGLWHRRTKKQGGGWEVHDWIDYQPTKAQVQKKKEVDDAKAEMARLHNWFHKSPPGKRVKAIVEARDGAFCCYCDEGPLRTDGDRKGSTRRTFDLIDPSTMNDWEWREGIALRPSEIERVALLWCVACGYCNAAKGKRAPDETDGYQILPGRGPYADPPRSTAIQSRLNPPVGSDLDGSGRHGPGRDGKPQASTSNPGPTRRPPVTPRLHQNDGGVTRVRPTDPAFHQGDAS
jgi:hypothetical protein